MILLVQPTIESPIFPKRNPPIHNFPNRTASWSWKNRERVEGGKRNDFLAKVAKVDLEILDRDLKQRMWSRGSLVAKESSAEYVQSMTSR